MATSPRLAAVLERATARRSRERRTLRLLSIPLLLVVIVPALSGKSHVSGHGSGLVLTLALCGFVGSFVVIRARGARLDRGDAALAPTIAALCVMAAAGVAMVYAQPTGAGALALSLVAYVAGARLELRAGIALVAVATAATVTAVAIKDSTPAVSISSSVLLAALLFAIARIYRRAEDDRERAEIATAELEDARERELESAAIAERGRIAREMHDVLAHSLSGLSLQLEGARLVAEHERVSPELQEMLSRSRRLASEGLDEAKRAVRALRGEGLPGLTDLDRLVADFNAGGLEVSLSIHGAPREVPSEAGLTLYRAAQEALTNVVRHSGARSANLELDFADGVVRLLVTDDGGSAAPALTDVGGGYGLSSMRERAKLVGGRVTAGPAGDGFRVEVELPT